LITEWIVFIVTQDISLYFVIIDTLKLIIFRELFIHIGWIKEVIEDLESYRTK
jgi:hypothetical protein